MVPWSVLVIFALSGGCVEALRGAALAPEAAVAPDPELERRALEGRILAATEAGPRQAAAAARAEAQSGHAAMARDVTLALLREGDRPLRQTQSLIAFFRALPGADSARLFDVLIASKRLDDRRLAWRLATDHPSAAMASAVERELSRRAARGGASTPLSPEAALAAAANALGDAYPMIRAALAEEGHPAFARALAKLNPSGAADELMAHLSLASWTELAPGPLRSVRRDTAAVALRHFAAHPPSTHHPALRGLFLYAAADDRGLAQLAARALAAFPPDQRRALALQLAQLPQPIQAEVAARFDASGDALLVELAEATRSVAPLTH